jgi:hypothetical protein
MSFFFSNRLTGALLAGGLLSLSSGTAVVVAQVFTIDTNRSSITISGSVLGSSITNQGPGSLTTSAGGSIQAVATAGTIQFVGQSVILAGISGSWQPNADGTAGSQPANYGATANTALGTGVAALRNVLLDVTSPVIDITGGQFDSSSLTFLFPSNATSSFAYRVSGGFISPSGSLPLTGYATNKVTQLATLTNLGNQQTLVLPVNATYHLKLLSPNDIIVTLAGQLVAVQSTPSPLAVQSIAVQSNTVTLQWQSGPGGQFQVQTSPDLKTWLTNATGVTSATGTYTWSGPATNALQFLRLAQ